MKKLGLIGGLSAHSTLYYYRLLVEESERILGTVPEFIIYNLDFQKFVSLDWDERARYLRQAATALRSAGAEVLAIAANTPHKAVSAIENLGEVVDIRDAVAEEARGRRRLLLLGTKTTMEEDFYRKYLEEKGFEVKIPGPEDRESIDRIIDRLTRGQVLEEDRKALLEILSKHQWDAVVLGCTELPLILQGENMIDSARAHVKAILKKLL